MNATLTEHIGGLAWSEDPLGRELSALRIDFEGAAPRSISLPRRGPVSLADHGDADTLGAVREELLEAERTLGGPAVVRWKAYGAGNIDASDARLIDEPLPWGGGPGRGLPHAPQPTDRWSRANAGEVIPNVMTPLSWSVIADALDRGFHAPWGEWSEGRRFVALYDGYAYFNIGLMMEIIQERLGLTGAHFLEAVGGPEAAEVVRPGGNGERSTKIRWLTMTREIPYMIRWLRDQDQLPKRWPDERQSCEDERDRLKGLDIEALSDREIFRELSRSSAESDRQTVFLMRAQAAVFSAAQGLLWATDRWLGSNRRDLVLSVLQGLPGVRTQEGNIALRRVAQRTAASPEATDFVRREDAANLWPAVHSNLLPASISWLRDELDAFMAEYGHRAAGELEAAEPRWVEQPELILDTFRDYVLHPERNNPDELLERQRTTRVEAETQIREHLSQHPLGRFRWMLFNAQIRQARRLQPLRENPKFSLLELSLQQRRLWKTLATRWIERDLLDDPDDVYFLLFDELATLTRRSDDATIAARMRSRIRRRRLQFVEWQKSQAPPLRDRFGDPIGSAAPAPGEQPPATVLVDDAESTPEPDLELPLTLRGIAASTGEAEGRAHVADSAVTGRALTPGQILVARFTDPGWTPIFPLAAAVVTEIGGVLSHGAIVAREFGIPAVVNVQKATQQIRSGDLLRVDGASGQVTIVERA
ncbi:MAG: PEP-utilizing enzyme [Chloroflexi bacterium]|nr:PEP-utilizing enzyme [Chloroflexota bacterium]